MYIYIFIYMYVYIWMDGRTRLSGDARVRRTRDATLRMAAHILSSVALPSCRTGSVFDQKRQGRQERDRGDRSETGETRARRADGRAHPFIRRTPLLPRINRCQYEIGSNENGSNKNGSNFAQKAPIPTATHAMFRHAIPHVALRIRVYLVVYDSG